MISFAHALYLFQVLSTVQQTRVSWTLSARKAELKRNSLLQKFETAYYTRRKFQYKECLDYKLTTDYMNENYINEKQTPSLHHGVWSGY